MDRDDLYGNQLSDQSYGDQTYGDRTYGEDYTTYRDTYSYRDYDYRDYGQDYGGYGDQEDVNWGSVITGALLTALGGYLIYRGVSSGDRSYGDYGQYGDRYSDQYGGQYSEDRSGGIEVEESVIINKPASELYSYWRDFENLPNVMSHLQSVKNRGTRLGNEISHWVTQGPAGTQVEWDAKLVDDRRNELISWRSEDDTTVPNEGSVQFEEASGGLGTKVTVSLTYHPPGGALGAAVARLFGENPAKQVREDLGKFRENVESGQILLSGTSNF